ncbi:MAG: NAD-binding protein [Acidimicrobiales bacterium]|nr:NAD-binding protein [Acidimicrobiales bacterium]
MATHLGPSGAGQLTKMANQICVVGLCQALAEGLDFAESAGLDVAQVISVMLKGSSTSWQMENRAETMLAGEYDFGFATPLMQKDIASCMENPELLGQAVSNGCIRMGDDAIALFSEFVEVGSYVFLVE